MDTDKQQRALKMPCVNDIIISGHLTRDPELKYTAGDGKGGRGVAVCTFSIANSRKFKRNGAVEEEVLFMNVKAWKQAAEYLGETLKAGDPVLVKGSLRMEKWTDKKGEEHSRLVLNAFRVDVLSRFDKVGGA